MTSSYKEPSQVDILYDHEENDDLCEQGKLRRLVKALILPYKGYSTKVAKEIGNHAIEEINEIITFALDLLIDFSFQRRLNETFKLVAY